MSLMINGMAIKLSILIFLGGTYGLCILSSFSISISSCLDFFNICLVTVIVDAILCKNLDKLVDSLVCPIKLSNELWHEIGTLLVDFHLILRDLLSSLGLLLLADVEDVVYRIYYLTNFFWSLILLRYLILEILLEYWVGSRYFFKFTLNILHVPLLLVKFALQITKTFHFHDLGFFHFFFDLFFPLK